MDARVRTGLLYDFYGPLLTARQQRFVELYFDEDLSLGEIAAEFEVSRQAVHDILRRSEAALEVFEAKLGLLERYQRERKTWERLRELVARLQASALEESEKKLVEEIATLVESMGREVD
ncbi:MAG: YlxM family DNA-binding protein [Firmicutes bacterium]|nr:YlxM family DNA-binding protein [Bacillota bacterium]